ncbi:hypothetical protein EOD42_22675 [Rhodovarius crocodyli]|uniref:Glycerol-3-phosphate dehydrogenase NAD-dependent N-terminal domain-containing protein n=1 Tax=Rhodovarius crocodyli TaxID=1979269 RepID=A0A437M1Q0_9PROT|nr:NAD(P)-binding domain-containing protein [Rhodovarius crocodyli]RVT91463.1 hypothetical protein EOD42_22675 [Rhodovarius crocodyli]
MAETGKGTGKPLRLAVLGAGPVGTASAALAASRGHDVTLYSPRGGGTRHIGASVTLNGLISGQFPVRVSADLGRALEGVDAVFLAVPGHAQTTLLERLARVLTGAPGVLVAPAASLSPLLLARLLGPRGVSAAVGGLVAPPVAARRLPDGRLWLGALRQRLWLGADAEIPRLTNLAEALFGIRVRPMEGMLSASLADMSGLGDAAQLLAPPGNPQAAFRLLREFARERDALAARFGLGLPDSGLYFDEIGGMPPMEPERALGQGGLALSFLVTLGVAGRVKVPMAEAALRMLEVFAGRSLRANPSLLALGEDAVRGVLRRHAA